MEKWEEGYYITAMAGSQSGSSLVVMSKGTLYTQQSYKVRVPSEVACSGWRRTALREDMKCEFSDRQSHCEGFCCV